MKKLDLIKVFAITAVIASGVRAQTIDWNAQNITITTAEQLKEFAALVNGNNDFRGQPITSVEQLKELALHYDAKDFRGQTIKLGNNINLNGSPNNQWTQIGFLDLELIRTIDELCEENDCSEYENYENNEEIQGMFEKLLMPSFQGTFDGAGFVISKVYISDISDSYYHSGLFGMVGENATIKNLGVSDSYIESSQTRAGGLAGFNSGIIENCYADANVTGLRAGGLVAWNGGTIKNCYAVGNVQDNSSYSGGLVGWNYGIIENSYATGNVTGHYSGGLVGGNNYNRDGANTITNCYATGNVTAEDIGGGLVGENDGFTISNCYATGNVTGERDDYNYFGGGLVGSNKGTIENCYATGDVTSMATSFAYVGGLVGSNHTTTATYDDDMITFVGTIKNCYSNGRIIYNENGYSILVGGLVGKNTDSNGEEDRENTVISSYYNKETSGQSDDEDKGTPKTTAEMKQQSTYVDWNFANIWTIDAVKNDGYPYLGIIEKQKTAIAKKSAKKTAQAVSFAGIKNGQINLNLKSGTYTAQLYNLQGRLIKSVDITAANGINATNLRIDNLSKGIFILNVKQAGTSVLQQKITVK